MTLVSIPDAARRWARAHIGIFRVQLLVGLARWPFLAAARRVSATIPRRSDLVAFGSVSNRLADNSAYVFLHADAVPELHAVWITGSRELVSQLRRSGHDARLRWSPRGIWAAVRAGSYVYSYASADVNRWLCGGAQMINLWHGVGVKRILRDRHAPFDRVHAAPEGSVLARAFVEEREVPDWLLTSAPAVTAAFSRTFGVPRDRCVELGYPRNDHLVAGRDAPAELVDEGLLADLRRANFVVGYFPTWRYGTRDAVPPGMPDLRTLARVLEDQDALLVFKGHHAQADWSTESAAVRVLPSAADLNAYLGLCDLLITDYSSVSSDFVLLGRPIITFVPDLAEALAGDWFTQDPRRMAPGIFVESPDELYDLLRDVRAVPAADNFDCLRTYYWTQPHAHAAESVLRFVRDTVAPSV